MIKKVASYGLIAAPSACNAENFDYSIRDQKSAAIRRGVHDPSIGHLHTQCQLVVADSPIP